MNERTIAVSYYRNTESFSVFLWDYGWMLLTKGYESDSALELTSREMFDMSSSLITQGENLGANPEGNPYQSVCITRDNMWRDLTPFGDWELHDALLDMKLRYVFGL